MGMKVGGEWTVPLCLTLQAGRTLRIAHARISVALERLDLVAAATGPTPRIAKNASRKALLALAR